MLDFVSAILFSTIGLLAVIVIMMISWIRKSHADTHQSKEQLIQALTHIEHFKAQIDELETELNDVHLKNETLNNQCRHYEKELSVGEEKLRSMKAQIDDWEKTKSQIFTDTKAAMFDSGGEIFKQEAEKLEKKTKEGFEHLIKSIASLNERLGQSETLVNTVWSALSTPHAVGSFSEIGLENTLKNYGLVAGRDFVMQYSIKSSDGDLRPDAVVFLSADNVMVIDSKASKFFLEVEQEQDEALREQKLLQLKKSMQSHLRSLSSKAYHESVKDYLKSAGKHTQVGHVYTIMFVHNEAVLHKLLEIDPDFMHSAQQKDIVISGPTGLAAAMSLARFDIVSQKQSENHNYIVNEVGALLGGLETTLKHAERMGKSVSAVASNFQKFSASVNKSLLPKARKVVKLGVTLPKNKELPGQLPHVHVSTEASSYIDGEVAVESSEVSNNKDTYVE